LWRHELASSVYQKAYNEHLIKIEKLTSRHAEKAMKDASERLRKKISAEQPDNIESGEIDIAHVAVTVDGTWQKRGHCSKIGVIFVITVDTARGDT
jgi:hypothetical protein